MSAIFGQKIIFTDYKHYKNNEKRKISDKRVEFRNNILNTLIRKDHFTVKKLFKINRKIFLSIMY